MDALVLFLWLSSTGLARWINESETVFGYSGVPFLRHARTRDGRGREVWSWTSSHARRRAPGFHRGPLPASASRGIGSIADALSEPCCSRPMRQEGGESISSSSSWYSIGVGIASTATMERAAFEIDS